MFEKRFSLLSITGALAVLGASVPGASADDGPASTDEGGWFVEVGAGAAFRFGDSSTKSGGGNMVGVVSDVEFDPAVTVGGGVGYQFSAPLGVFLSYDYIGGDVSWLTTFAPTNITAFNGSAHSHIILANVRYSKEVFKSTRISALLGAGGSINQLQDVAESCVIPCPPGQFIADVEDGDQASFAARLGFEVGHDLTDAIELKLGANVDYYGAFESGKSRNLSGGTSEPIGTYRLDPTWGTTVMGQFVWRFH